MNWGILTADHFLYKYTQIRGSNCVVYVVAFFIATAIIHSLTITYKYQCIVSLSHCSKYLSLPNYTPSPVFAAVI